jgi:hypothetical protein
MHKGSFHLFHCYGVVIACHTLAENNRNFIMGSVGYNVFRYKIISVNVTFY